MDTKLLSKVPTWNGDEDQWFEWSFAFRAYCVVSSLISSEDLERAAGSTTSLPLSGQSPEARVRSGTLYYLLVLLCTGKAQVILRTVEVGNGVEGWRVLSARYDRRDTTSTTGLLQAILGFEMSDDLERIPDKLAEFELMVQRYNMTSGETLSGQVEKATILRTLPEPLKSHLLVNAQRFTNGAEVRTAVRDYLMARREWRPPTAMTRERDTSSPMDVDEVTWRWKGGNSKGKGKDKGKHSKGKGKGKDKDKDGKGKSKKDTECWWCGKRGHTQRDCWEKQAGRPRVARPDKVQEVLEQQESESVSSSSVAVISNLTQNLDGWVFEISRTVTPIMKTICSVSGNLEETYVWLDSACYDHVCGSSFAKDCGIIRNDEFSRQTDIRAANGSSMQHLGVRTVRMQTVCDHQNLQITFQVLNVERPLISVGKLAKDGCEINFDGTGGFIHHKGRSLRFERVGDMFGIRVRVLGNSGSGNSVPGAHNPVMPTVDESSGFSPSASSSFNPMPSFDQEMSPLESGEAEPPQIRRPLTSPSDAERRRHETSHLPFREWCEHCVRGRGRAMPHFSRQRRGAEESVPVVQLDYTYMKGVSGPKALSIVDRDTSYGTSSVVLAKGSSDRYAVAMGVQFLDHLGHEEVILQSDAEPAAVDVARAIAKSFKGRAIVREVPRDSSKSNGTVERFHQSMQGLARTLRCETIEKYRVPDDDFLLERLLPWIVRHSSWLLSRFQIHTDGNTSYKAIHGYVYSSQIFPFAQTVLVKAGRAAHPTEIDWLDGIWVGRVSKSDEHLVLTEKGAIYSRTVRPHPQGERVREIFDKVRGLPWNPSGRVEPTVRSDEPPPVQPPTTRREYLREFGKTANCRACEGIPGRHHTKFCQDRFEAWQKERGFSGVPTDQRDSVEKDPVSEPVMTGDLLDPEVAGSTLPTERGKKREETESDQTPAARRRLVFKQGVKREDEMESDQPPAARRRLVSKQGRNVTRIKNWNQRAHSDYEWKRFRSQTFKARIPRRQKLVTITVVKRSSMECVFKRIWMLTKSRNWLSGMVLMVLQQKLV